MACSLQMALNNAKWKMYELPYGDEAAFLVVREGRRGGDERLRQQDVKVLHQ